MRAFKNLVPIVCGCLAIASCVATQELPPGVPAAVHEAVFQVGLQQGSVAIRDQRNSTRVIVTDTGGVTLGSQTDKYGFAAAANKSPDWFQAELDGIVFNSELFGKEIYRSEGSLDSSLNLAGQGATATLSQKHYVVIYEWSRYGTIALKDAPPQFSVVKGDYGFAVRLVLNVEIKDTEATAKLGLGPGNLDAALALGVATVSARLQTLGTTASFLPEEDIDIRSAKELTEATQRFHKAGQRLERSLAECDIIIAFDHNTGAQIPPVTPIPAYCAKLKRPAMLAYVSFGDGIGDRLREYQLISAECNAYRSGMQRLTLKKAASADAKLPDSEWKQLTYLTDQFVECGARLGKLEQKATEAEQKAAQGEQAKMKGLEPPEPLGQQ